MPLMISRSSSRDRPVAADDGSSGLINSHWGSVKSDGYGLLFSSSIRVFSAQLAIFRDGSGRFYSGIHNFFEF
jgi:hypothetical protein